ncbi:Uncharacterised protein [Mycobacteroides abscessus subsp. abscessus]|nr:Uncharacterised protein [Mycobacteroides abscessus subsp. abscessus]
MVSDGFTPRLAEMVEPSMTCRPRYPYITTPVMGMSNRALQPAPAMPSILSATRCATSCPAGIQVGFGSPAPCLVVIVRPNSPRLV